ncbi:7397_t:CDS:2 [Acaulospora colombiana]|uniref:7397_t:CDS:1 n=1 Tax=Acaulospora colombiana TaxID=27376 RepID=A0ACA9LJQ9_9GLOM|nr:7397_t:CDS:2 [Acaulospora colombiana]
MDVKGKKELDKDSNKNQSTSTEKINPVEKTLISNNIKVRFLTYIIYSL